jgi:hypothetical protein
VLRLGLLHIPETQPNWEVVAEAGVRKTAILKAIEAEE